jgi:methyl-accepting chemotaxis protein
MAEVADGIVALTAESERVATAMDIFGARSGPQLLPLLKQGSAGIDELRQRAKELGLTMSSEAAAASAAFQDSLTDLSESAKMAKFNLGQVFLPVLTDVTEQVGALTGHFNNLTDTQKSIVGWGVATSGALATVGGSALLLIGYLPRLKAGFDLLAGSAGVLMFTKLAAVLGAVGSAAWAGKRIWDAHNESVDMAAIKMNSVTEVNRAAYESLQTINTELERMVREGWDPATVIMGDMNLSLLDLRENLGMMVDPWTNVNDLIEVLNKRLYIANKETKAGAEGMEEIAEGTGLFGEAIKTILSPLSILSGHLQGIRSGVGNMTALLNEVKALGFLPAVPKMIDTSAEARARAAQSGIPQNWLAEVVTAEAAGTLIGLEAIEQKEKEITEYLKTHKKLAEEINEADKAARSEPWAIDPLEKIRAKNKEWLDKYESDTKTTLGNTIDYWKNFTKTVEDEFRGLFDVLLDPSIKNKWDGFFDGLTRSARNYISDILTAQLFGRAVSAGGPSSVAGAMRGGGPAGGGTGFGLPTGGYTPVGPEGPNPPPGGGGASPVVAFLSALPFLGQAKKAFFGETPKTLSGNAVIDAKINAALQRAAHEQGGMLYPGQGQQIADQIMSSEAAYEQLWLENQPQLRQAGAAADSADRADPYGREVVNPNLAPAAPSVNVGRIEVVLPDLQRTTPAEIETMINTQLLPAIQSAVQRGHLNRIILTT